VRSKRAGPRHGGFLSADLAEYVGAGESRGHLPLADSGALALRRDAAKSRSSLHEHHAEHVQKLLDANRQRGLTHVARFDRAPKMLLACKRKYKLHLSTMASCRGAQVLRANLA
jgi:hypothetical protein